MRKIVLIISLLTLSLCLFAQTHTRVFNEQIRTLCVERRVLLLENNAINGSDPENTLHISFDEMSHEVHFYTYTVHMLNCELLNSEYLQGFTTKDITDYEHSLNTSRIYTHYWFTFPGLDFDRGAWYRVFCVLRLQWSYECGDRQ